MINIYNDKYIMIKIYVSHLILTNTLWGTNYYHNSN